ncbi:MAG: 16S rRNA (guanine(527)-N(7))-methyltransferase RsmG [Lachnospiraceae bacterium]|nr:16S rRNA (guanine(527)-N(7))-methyltransferase RsmG [Lachnospiraceae bacterium]
MKDINIIKNKLENLNLQPTQEQLSKLYSFYELLIEKNKVMNLTGITEYEEVIDKHFVDSVSIIKAIDLNKKIRVIDLGTGAGFPGIPLKIMFPNIEIVLVDSLNKRIKFLEEVVEQLQLTDISCIHSRAEDLAQNKEYREQFDLCVSRAVANLSTLCEYCIPFVKVGGNFVSYKSGVIQEELEQAKYAISTLGGELSEVINFTLPETDIERSFIKIKKNKNTQKKYPRKAGLPGKEPLEKKCH